MSRQQSLEQKRAAAAWDCVDAVRKGRHAYAAKYKQVARSAAADIQANGLGQTLAFWRAKGYDKGQPKSGGNEHSQILDDTGKWVAEQLGLQGDLLAWIVKEAGTGEYRRATAEAIAFLTWLKRFAEAELGGDG